MVDKKKEKTIEELVDEGIAPLIGHYQGMRGQDFSARVGKFEEFFQKEMPVFIQSHVNDIVHGEKGAYIAAVSALNASAKNETAKITSEDEIAKIMESYVDQFLKSADSRFDEMIAHAKAEGLSEEEIRNMKGMLFSRYHRRQDGTALNPLEQRFIKQFKGKTKAHIKNAIKNLADVTSESYGKYLVSKATDLFTEDDQLDMSKYTKSLMDKAGYTHPDHPLTKNIGDLIADITTYHQRGNLAERGYKAKPAEKPKK